ncbi:MAG: SIMPL domain-containing protein [Thermodesulfovibrionales bacterium]|nr:SIMPL domain-containing protein [Thermodesulfovibrionales bacterium]
MKKFLVLFAISIILFTFSAANGQEKLNESERTIISITLEEKRELNPDILGLNLSISAKAEREAEVLNMLGIVDRAVRDLRLNYKGGSYSVYKNCWWEKDRRKCSGYKGELSYFFKLKETKEQNRLLDVVDTVKEKYGEKLSYTVSHPEWIISESRYKDAESELKIEIIETSKEFAKKVGERIGRYCSISEINYDIKRSYWEHPALLKARVMPEIAAIEPPEPKKEDKAVTVKAQIRLFCIDKK